MSHFYLLSISQTYTTFRTHLILVFFLVFFLKFFSFHFLVWLTICELVRVSSILSSDDLCKLFSFYPVRFPCSILTFDSRLSFLLIRFRFSEILFCHTKRNYVAMNRVNISTTNYLSVMNLNLIRHNNTNDK